MALSDRERLALNLRIAREAAHISQEAAGKLVEKSRGTIVNWENAANSAEPSTDEVATLAKAYGLTSQQLRYAKLNRPKRALVRALPDIEQPGSRLLQSAAKQTAAKSGGRNKGKGDK